ncbi:MAG: SDR family oxidoreductase [Acidobacteriota bacterium]
MSQAPSPKASQKKSEKRPPIPQEMSPNRYIEKVSLATGEVVDEPIHPQELLVATHRDYNLVEIQAQRLLSRLATATGDDERAERQRTGVHKLGQRTTEVMEKAIGHSAATKVSKTLLGYEGVEHYFRYRRTPLAREEIRRRLDALQRQAEERLQRALAPEGSGIRVLLTGGTGFVGQEILAQAAEHPGIAEVVVVIRPKRLRDNRAERSRKRVISPEERGERLLEQLWIDGAAAKKFRFVAGDVEQPHLGIAEEERERLRGTITHLIHSAASVAFDDPYERSFDANVRGSLHALALAAELEQGAPEGERPFISYLGIETSYIHGRQTRKKAREDYVHFPRNYYNNYYELTKAMASLETERYMLNHGLPVVQLCPSIVIGDSRTGNNRGDTKVINAPVNLFGRAHKALAHKAQHQGLLKRSKTWMLARLATTFPGDPSAQLNLIPVDWVARGILAALDRPGAVGERVHLATDKRLSSEDIRRMVAEEIGVKIRMAEPTLHRNVTLPVTSRLLRGAKQPHLAHALEKLGNIFGGYSEWGQPIHQVGHDVEVLGMPAERPETQHAFRMLCRHNRWVQEFGQVRDPDEISRRERLWVEVVERIEAATGGPAGALSAEEFQQQLGAVLDVDSFQLREGV